eukprot:643006-Prymnesium_polylepis.3
MCMRMNCTRDYCTGLADKLCSVPRCGVRRSWGNGRCLTRYPGIVFVVAHGQKQNRTPEGETAGR